MIRTTIATVTNVAIQIGAYIAVGAAALAAAAQIALAWLIALGPIALVIVAVVALVALIILNWERIKQWTIAAWNAIVGAVTAAWNAIVTVVQTYIAIVSAVISAVLGFILGVFQLYWNAVKAVISAVWSAIVAIVTGYINAIKAVLNWFGSLGSLFSGWFNAAKNAAGSALDGLVGFVRGIPGRILGALGNLGGLLFNVGADIINGLISGIKWVAHKVADAVSAIVDKIPGPIKKIMGISSPSKVMRKIGQQIGDGLQLGMLDKVQAVASAAVRLAGFDTSLGSGSSGGPGYAVGGSTSVTHAPVINLQNGASAADVLEEIKWSYRFAGS
jgi:phage-related protein